MKTEINLDTWKRKSHFEFFSAMDEPFYGLTVEMDVTYAYKKAKELNTSLTHARGFQYPDSSPKVSIGKMMDKNGRKFFNVALFAHHGLVDGIDMGRFFDLFQDILNR